jgi:hypothetical protein
LSPSGRSIANKRANMLVTLSGVSDQQSDVSRHRRRRDYGRQPIRSCCACISTFRDADWAGDIGHGQTAITVVLKQPEVKHAVRMRDFEALLESNGRSPAEMVLSTVYASFSAARNSCGAVNSNNFGNIF